jgi:polysaccharide biosynthesis/export protein
MMRKGMLLGLAVAVAGMLCACRTARGPKFDARNYEFFKTNNVALLTNLSSVDMTNSLRPEFRTAQTNFYTLGPGDKIEIELANDPNSRIMTTVGPDGKVYFHLLPGIDVWGLTLAETRARLEDALQKYVVSPQVGVQLRGIDSKRVWLLGRVQKPGVYPIGAPMTILESLSLAGGTMSTSVSGTTEDLADLSHAFVIRNGERLPLDLAGLIEKGDMSQNIYLQPDDFVYFPSSLSRDIFVLGAVRLPKAVSRQQGTLAAAIAAAGGPGKDAYLSQVAIVRGSLAKPQIAVVNFDDIQKGRATDIALEPRDIVYVPLSPYRYLSKYADLILTTFVRAVAINEGARAGGATQPAGVSIGVVNFPQTTVPTITPSP